MNVLLIGGGGREHALAKKIAESLLLTTLYVAPGNGGTSQMANVQNIDIKATDLPALLEFAIKHQIDMTIVGSDDPLAMGIVDLFQEKDLRIFGPTAAAAKIESSKAFSKKLMYSAKIPTAEAFIVSKYEDALQMVNQVFGNGIEKLVIKASGLALGKGAYVCNGLEEAELALDAIMVKRVHGNAGDEVVIENFIEGPEISLHAFCDGKTYSMFPTSQDHKAIFDDDKGANTGGMGAVAPISSFTDEQACHKIFELALASMRNHVEPFSGLLYPGIKISSNGPVVLEFNARFGDPETQVYVSLLKTDILEIFNACIDGKLDDIDVQWKNQFAVCVILASAGYPGDCKKGFPITGIDKAESIEGVTVFHAGTMWNGKEFVTSGGRVLGITALGDTLDQAIDTAYAAAACIQFEGKYCRTDIGQKSLKAMELV
jgi:phosphoribosylamine--glycine ligase